MHPNDFTPAQFTAAFSEADKDAVRRINFWLSEPDNVAAGWNATRLARRAGVNQATLSQLLSGKYPSPPAKHLAACLQAIETDTKRRTESLTEIPYVETSVHRAVYAACRRAKLYRNFAVISAFVGTGKTTAVRRFAAEHAGVVLIESTPDMTSSVLLDELVRGAGAAVKVSYKNHGSRGTKSDRMAAIIQALKGTDTLIVLDEAETVAPSALEYIRRVRDQAGVGVMLSGTEKLQPLVRDPMGKFGQISSRVGFWPPIIMAITREDAEALTRAALGEREDLTPAVLDACWQVCDGSARILCEGLIPGVHDYGLRKGAELTPELIFRVGNDILGFRPRRG